LALPTRMTLIPLQLRDQDRLDANKVNFMFVPIRKGDSFFGCLMAGRLIPYVSFKDEEVNAFTSFAMQAATAVNDDKMNEAEQRAMEELWPFTREGQSLERD